MRWAIYYANGDRVTDSDQKPEDVPTRGVIAIGQAHDRAGRIILSKHDYYWWTDHDQWFGGDIFGLWDYLCTPGWKRVLFGRSVTDGTFETIMTQATDDDYLPPKAGRHPRRER
jgi:hypothetical protein